MQDDVAEVDQDPVAFGAITFDADAAIAVFVLKFSVDFVGDGVHLAGACAGDDDEEVDDGGDAGEVEDEDILAAQLVGDAGCSNSVGKACFVERFGTRSGGNGGSGESGKSGSRSGHVCFSGKNCGIRKSGMLRRSSREDKPELLWICVFYSW